ncbi:MAG TPA: hypothetical protein VGD98_19535 [Ktedonobacteraceae bacterium]
MFTQKKIRCLYMALASCLYGLFLSMLLAAPVRTYAENTPANPVVFSDTMTSTENVIQYWTPKRMASALSADIPAIDEKVAVPRAHYQSRTRQATGYRQARPNSSPTNPLYSQVGKVFFSNEGKDFVCSGTIVASLNRSLVDTAGHCVVNSKHFVSNWVFCPMYNGNGCHFYIARILVTDKLWLDHSDRPDGWYGNDFGMAVVVSGTPGGKKLADAFGSITGLTNIDYVSRKYLALGYPAAPPFTGRVQIKCESSVLKTDDNQNTESPPGIACDMTGGSSGGGWFLTINGQLYLNGHTSYGYNNDPGVLYSPYFGTVWLDLFRESQVINV